MREYLRFPFILSILMLSIDFNVLQYQTDQGFVPGSPRMFTEIGFCDLRKQVCLCEQAINTFKKEEKSGIVHTFDHRRRHCWFEMRFAMCFMIVSPIICSHDGSTTRHAIYNDTAFTTITRSLSCESFTVEIVGRRTIRKQNARSNPLKLGEESPFQKTHRCLEVEETLSD